MLDKNAIRKVEKLGMLVTCDENHRYVRHNGRVLSWYVQDGRILCIHTKAEGERMQPEIDY
jgi:hypothetical protein